MKAKHLFPTITVAVALTVGGLWLGRTAWHDSTKDIRQNATNDPTKPGMRFQPPDPNRRFRDLSPEQRVRRARQPQDIGG